MKNVEEIILGVPLFRVRVQGAPPPKGWFVKYVSGMEDKPDIKPGYCLSRWHVGSDGYATFNFESVLDLHFKTEAQATAASKALEESAEIKTEVVKIGT